MKVVFAALALTCSLLFSLPTRAEETLNKLHLIISWDMSGSMRTNGPVDWTRAGADFFNEYFSNYHHRCQVVTVDMISWGLQSLPPVHIELKTRDESDLLADYASKLTRFKHDGTSPRVGMLYANSYVAPGYNKTVILFVSDSGINGEGNSELWHLVEPTTEFYGISLSDSLSRNYVANHIVPQHGRHFHAETESHFRDILTMILDDLGQDNCPTS